MIHRPVLRPKISENGKRALVSKKGTTRTSSFPVLDNLVKSFCYFISTDVGLKDMSA